jgi:outer membrane receptor protein involved in Fe transport
VGVPTNIGGSFNLNYRKKWTNLFASYGLEYEKSPGGGSSFQTFFPGDTLYYTIREIDRERGGWSHNVRFGSDFFLNDKNTITVAAIYRISDEDNDYGLNYQDLDGDRNLLFVTDRYDNELEIDKNSEYSINYTKTFGKEGQKLSADVQYRDNNETEESSINETTYSVAEDLEEPELFQRSINDEFDRGWLIQADYEHPFGKDGKLEVGFRNSIRRIGNDYVVEQLNDETGNWENLEGFSNNFNYDENIYASYAIFGNKTNKFSYQLGMRMEITDIRTELEQTTEVNEKNYTDFFPSLHLTYQLKQEKFLQGSYSRRIRRPWFRSLNPFSSFSDARNIRAGNPDLDPTYSDSYELGVLQNWEKSSFYYALYYRYSTGVVNRITTVADGITYTRPVNVGTDNDIGLEVTYSNEFNSWLRVNGTANLYHSVMDAVANGEDLGTETTTFFTRVMSQMKIKKEWDLQTSLTYRAPQNVPQGRRQSYFVVDLGLSRDVLKGNGTLTLSVRDLFNTRKYRYETITPTYTSEAEFQWRSRSAILSFNYRLNQRKQRERGGRGGGDNFDGGDIDF